MKSVNLCKLFINKTLKINFVRNTPAGKSWRKMGWFLVGEGPISKQGGDGFNQGEKFIGRVGAVEFERQVAPFGMFAGEDNQALVVAGVAVRFGLVSDDEEVNIPEFL